MDTNKNLIVVKIFVEFLRLKKIILFKGEYKKMG